MSHRLPRHTESTRSVEVRKFISPTKRTRLALLFAGLLPFLACSSRSSDNNNHHNPAPPVASAGDAATNSNEEEHDCNEDGGCESDAGVEDDAGSEDEDVHESGPVITDTDEGVDLGDFSPTEGMGQSVRSLATALRARPRSDNAIVTFINPLPTGWQLCGTAILPGVIARAGRQRNQDWWDSARERLNHHTCTTIDTARELPFGFPIDTDSTFAAVSNYAERPIRPGSRLSMREHLRRNFMIAFHETELYRFLEARSPDLASQFARLVTNGIPAQETSFGANITISRTGAVGIMQTQRSSYADARRNSAWNRAFRGSNGRPMRVSFASVAQTPWQSARVAALEFDNIFRHFRSKWAEPNHPVWRYPEAFLVPALIGAYHSGPTRISNMLDRRLADSDMQDLLRGEDREAILNQGYIRASTQYFLNRTDGFFGRASVPYPLLIYTWDALFEGDNDTEPSDVGASPSVSPTETSHNGEMLGEAFNRWAHARLEDIKTQRFVRVENAPALGARVPFNRDAWNFATRNVSQGNIRVHAWLMRNDALARRLAGGVANDAVLESTVQGMVHDHTFVAADPHRRPLLAFDPANITEQWRRVIRADHVPVVEKLTEELNAILRTGGMNPELFVIPMINSTVRSRAANNRLRGHSPRSAHLTGAAIDMSRRQYVVMRRMRNGSYQRAISSIDSESYFQALIQASVRLARQGMLFVRYHGPPQHFHIVPRVRRAR
ncbi:MAG: hypothetical protein HY817_01915 [Candidatus Abawacabacteria bacterium]|nr:hypothetical protein [Candidatus Abawacabacteria bacterium]